jgi:hypothetical protein
MEPTLATIIPGMLMSERIKMSDTPAETLRSNIELMGNTSI